MKQSETAEKYPAIVMFTVPGRVKELPPRKHRLVVRGDTLHHEVLGLDAAAQPRWENAEQSMAEQELIKTVLALAFWKLLGEGITDVGDVKEI